MARKRKETFTVEPDERGDGYWVWGHSTYECSSVLAGRPRHRRVKCYDTVEEAVAEYPSAGVSEYATSHSANKEDTASFMRSPAPSWFDPADAGEEW